LRPAVDRGDCLWPSVYWGDMPVRARWRGPMRSGTHFFVDFPVRGCVPAMLFCCRDGCTP